MKLGDRMYQVPLWLETVTQSILRSGFELADEDGMRDLRHPEEDCFVRRFIRMEAKCQRCGTAYPKAQGEGVFCCDSIWPLAFHIVKIEWQPIAEEPMSKEQARGLYPLREALEIARKRDEPKGTA